MNDYYEINIHLTPCTEDATDYMAAVLGDIGFESFVPNDSGLKAYIKAEDYDQESLKKVLDDFIFECSKEFTATLVPGQDWNSEWEKNYFQPIIVGDECVIHSSFHRDIPTLKYDIVIDPKMAFGTGHHATTSLIIEELLKMDLKGKSVIDMGTGTGILAILAAMLGATDVYGIEIDKFAFDNAKDNIILNNHPEIKLIHGDASALEELPKVDLFIANINRNIITADLSLYANKMVPGAVMLLSGFYEHDIPIVMETAIPLGLTKEGYTIKGDNWACLKLGY